MIEITFSLWSLLKVFKFMFTYLINYSIGIFKTNIIAFRLSNIRNNLLTVYYTNGNVCYVFSVCMPAISIMFMRYLKFIFCF